MHGVIFASFRDYVTARFGPDVAHKVMDGEPIFLMSEAYEDERLFRLLKETCQSTDVATDELVRDFGVFTAQTTFARLYPAFFSIAPGTRQFLLTVEDLIHELVRATIPNAKPPELHVEPLGDDGVRIQYTSPRHLCVLLEGLVTGTALHYGEDAEITESACMRQGDPACLFDVRLTRRAPAA